MKKSNNFRIFTTINLKKITQAIGALVLSMTIISTFAMLVTESISPEFLSYMLSFGAKTPVSAPANIAETMLSLSVPSLSVQRPVQDVTPVITQPPTEPVATPLVHTANEITILPTQNESADALSISNQSGKSVDTQKLLKTELNLSLTDEPTVLIVHTHTTESYTPSQLYNYIPTETCRTTDESFNMVAIGKIIAQRLGEKGVNVIHDKTVNDKPSYSASYAKSLKLVESYIKKYPSIKIVIDVHRDAIGDNTKTLTSFDAQASQVMLVIGTNGSGLTHPDWETNLAFALKLQNEMNSLYPSLARPINLRKERFNQHTAPFAFILEVGTNGNTLEEAKKGAEYFSESLISLLKL